MANNLSDPTVESVTDYTEVLGRYGPRSSEARQYLADRSDDERFQRLAHVATEIAENDRLELIRKRATLIGIVVSLIAVATLVGWQIHESVRLETQRTLAKRGNLLLLAFAHQFWSTRFNDLNSDSRARQQINSIEAALEDATDEERSKWSQDALYAWALIPFYTNDMETAKKRVAFLKQVHPGWSKAYSYEGYLYTGNQEVQEAAFETAIRLNKAEVEQGEDPRPDAYNNYAWLLLTKAATIEEVSPASDPDDEATEPYTIEPPFDTDLLLEAHSHARMAVELDLELIEAEGIDRFVDDTYRDTLGAVCHALHLAGARTTDEASWATRSENEYKLAASTSRGPGKRREYERLAERVGDLQ